MKRMYCPICATFVAPRIETVEQRFKVRGEPIDILGQVPHCGHCGEALVDEDNDSALLEKAYSLYRTKHGLLAPQAIRALREKYGLSQRSLARLLGWGDITVHRYESGALQDLAHDSLLRLIQDPSNLETLLDSAKDRIPPSVLELLRGRIQALLEAEEQSHFRACVERMVAYQTADQFSGYRPFDPDRFVGLVIALINSAGGLLKTKLNKMLWYSDFLHCKRMSVSITGSPYLHYQYGPVPRNYELLMTMMEMEGLIKRNERVYDAANGIVGEVFTTSVVTDWSMFSNTEQDVVQTIASHFESHSATRIKDASHGEAAYKDTADGEMIPYTYAKDLSLFFGTDDD